MSAPRSAARVAETAPGVERLTLGLGVAADLMLLVCLLCFVFEARLYPFVGGGIAAWALLGAVYALNRLGTAGVLRLPRWWFGASLATLGVAVLLDASSTWDTTVPLEHEALPFAAVAAGAVLLSFVTTGDTVAILVSTVVLLLALLVRFGAASLQHATADATTFGTRILLMGLAVLPPLVGVQILRSFRAMLEFQSDLSQAQSATSSPELGVGLLAAEQLEQLDLRAERLLDDVATGRERLPLSPGTAELAGTIATRLRVSLIAGKSKTWLHHALADSAVVGRISRLDDPEALAALMAPDQRDGLLSGIWMLVGAGVRQAESLSVTIREASGEGARTRRLAILIELSGVPRRRVDPAAWQAINKVGPYTEHAEAGWLRVAVDCALDVVAER